MDPSLFSFRLKADNVKHELVNLKQLVFEVTDACNLRCKYCVFGEFYSGFDQRVSQFLSFSEAKAVIDYLVDLWSHNAVAAASSQLCISFYGGEPLLNVPLIRQVVDYVHEIQVPKTITFSMTTNCVLLDRYMDYLVENDFHLLCSLDGNSRSDAYRIRQDGSPSYDQVFANIKLLQKKYPDYFVRNVDFNAVLHNLNDVPGLLSFFKQEFDKVPMISELNAAGIRKDQKDIFLKTFRSMRDDLFQANNRENLTKQLGFEAPDTQEMFFYFNTSLGNVFETYSDLLSKNDNVPQIPSGTCLPFSRKLFVKANGKIMPCERIHHNFSAGSVKEGKVYLDIQEVADCFNFYLKKITPRCSVCASKESCGRCFYNIDGIESDHFVCDSFMTLSQLKQKEHYYTQYLYHHPSLYREFMNEITLD